MKLVFFGTPEFASSHLVYLLNAHHDVLAVVTAPDKPSGRGLKTQVSAVKNTAIKYNLPVLQPNNLKDADFINALSVFHADVFIVVAFRMLPEIVWAMPKWGTYNIHASLLPQLRGAAPINWSLMHGHTHTGITMFKISMQIDTGTILLQRKMQIKPEWNAGILHEHLMQLGCATLMEGLEIIKKTITENAVLPLIDQNHELATHAPKLFKQHQIIDWSKSKAQVLNTIRGLAPNPGAITYATSKSNTKVQIKILSAKAFDTQVLLPHISGTVLKLNNHIIAAAADGWLELCELQLEGKRRMDALAFANGAALYFPNRFFTSAE
jgi:methionyl-tRNA formyltransferase